MQIHEAPYDIMLSKRLIWQNTNATTNAVELESIPFQTFLEVKTKEASHK